MRFKKLLASVVCLSTLLTSTAFLPQLQNSTVLADDRSVEDYLKDSDQDGVNLAGVVEKTDRRDLSHPQAVNMQYEILPSALLKEIENAVSAFEAELDVSSYNLSMDDITAIRSDIKLWSDMNPKYFYLTSTSIYYSGKKIAVFKFLYSTEKAAAMRRLEEIDLICYEAMTHVKSGMSDYQKALVLHDWLANHVAYSYDRYLSDTLVAEDYNAYGALVLREAVCQGYAEAYHILMSLCGIECYVVSSKSLNHAWNVVKIDGQYYNLDVTWDDPVYDILGRVNHYYFLVDNNTMQNRSTQTGGSVHTPSDNFDASKLTSTRFANAKWVTVSSRINYYNGKWFFPYYDSGKCTLRYTTDPMNSLGTVFYTFSSNWNTSNGGYWIGCFSRPQLFGKYLIFNSSSEILYMDLSNLSNPAMTMYSSANLPGVNASSGVNIYGFKVDDKILYYSVNSEPKSSAGRTISNKLKSVVGNTPTPTKRPTNTPTKKPTTTPTPVQKPAAPKNVQALPTSTTSITITWDAVSGASGYQVWRGTSATGSFTALGSYTTTSKVSTGLTAGTTYYYKVRAYKLVNGTKYFGSYSSVVSSPTKVAKTANVKAVSASGTSIKVTWDTVQGATGYQVWRGESATGSFTALGSYTTNSKVSTGLTPNKTYYYKVRAFNEVNGTRYYGAYSDIVSANPKLATPSGVKAAVSSATAVTVSWNKVTGATGYEVWRCETSNGTYVKLGSLTETTRKCPGLTTGKTYYFKVRAYVTVNGTKYYSSYSSVVSATPKA